MPKIPNHTSNEKIISEIPSRIIHENDIAQVKQNKGQDTSNPYNKFKDEPCSKCLNLLVDNGGHRIPEIVKLAENSGVILESVELRKPTLDDVFLSVTGRNIREEEGSFMDMIRRHRIMQQARGRATRG